MDATEKENELNVIKYSDETDRNHSCCKSQELVLVRGLQEGASSSRSNDFKMKNENKFVCRKKSLLPIFAPNHPYRSAYYTVSPNCKSNVSLFTQRIMSAKLLGVKNLQNKLTETQIRLQEFVDENRVLNALLKRQERALKKYEGEEAQLPQLIKTHSDEMRVLQTKYKQLKTTCHDLELKLKARDNDLNCLREQHKHLLFLSKDKHLGEREKLRQQVEELHETVSAQEEKIKTLLRKVELESKNYKHQLRVKIGKHRETQRQLSLALSSIQKLEAALEVKHKYVSGIPSRQHHFSASSALIGPLPAISKQTILNNHGTPLKERLSEKPPRTNQLQEKNENDSNVNTVSSSVPNSSYEGSELFGGVAKNQKTVISSTDSRKTKTEDRSSDSSRKNRSKSRDSINYEFNFESSDSAKASNSDQETVKTSGALPDIFVNESPELLKSLRSEKVSSEETSSKKSLTRQDSVQDEDSESYRSKTKNKSKSASCGQNNEKSLKNGSASQEEFSWEEIKKQVQKEHELAKKKLETYARNSFDADLLDFSINHELDSSKKDALLKALNDIDREKNFYETELNSDSDSSLSKNSRYREDFSSYYRGDIKLSPSDEHLSPLQSVGQDTNKRKNGLVRDWFYNQHNYDVSTKAAINNDKIHAVSTNTLKDSDSSN